MSLGSMLNLGVKTHRFLDGAGKTANIHGAKVSSV